jgi:hypothetical protein
MNEDVTVVGRPGSGRRAVGRRRVVAALITGALVVVTGCSFSPAAAPSATTVAREADRPNIVFVLTDDLAGNLVRYMPHVRALQRSGATFSNYTVTDSLCCPSRASILTGDYLHNTGVLANSPPFGGYAAFLAHGDEEATFAVALQRAGYRNAFMGKYMNGYDVTPPDRYPRPPVPSGWDEWDGVGYGYPEYDYWIAHNTSAAFRGHRPRDYLTTVLARRATAFIGSAAAPGSRSCWRSRCSLRTDRSSPARGTPPLSPG